MSITLTHTDTEGTMAGGTSKGDGTAPILKAAGFRWSSVGWIIRGSRWHAPRINLHTLADQLRAAGFKVDVAVDLTPAPAAEKAAAQDEASARRVDGLTAKAARVGAQADALYEKAHQMADAIPFGQPILTDHYSAPADRRYRDRIHNTFGKSFALHNEAQVAAGRAQAAEAHAELRGDPRLAQRRITRNEAELRKWERSAAATDRATHPVWFGRADAEMARLTDQITYDRQQIAAAEAAGLKLWGREDFAKGDMVKVRYGGVSVVKVVRVNAKSVSVHIDGRSWTDTIPYADVLGKVTAP